MATVTKAVTVAAVHRFEWFVQNYFSSSTKPFQCQHQICLTVFPSLCPDFQSQHNYLFYISCSPSPLKQRLWWSRSRVTLRTLKGATWQKARRSWGGLFSLSVKEGQKAATLSTYSFYLPETTLPLFCSWETTRQGHVPVQGLSTEHCNERVRVWVFTAGGKQHGMAAQPHVRRKKKLGVICQICRHHVSLCSSTWLSGPLVVPQISSVR